MGCNRRFKLQCFEEVEEKEEEEAGIEEILQKTVIGLFFLFVSETHLHFFFFFSSFIGHRLRLVELFVCLRRVFSSGQG